MHFSEKGEITPAEVVEAVYYLSEMDYRMDLKELGYLEKNPLVGWSPPATTLNPVSTIERAPGHQLAWGSSESTG